MPPVLSLSTNTRLTFALSDTADIGGVSASDEVRTARSVSNGTGSGQANAAWATRVTIAAGQVYSFDLTDLPLNVFNLAGRLTLSVLKDVLVVNNETAAGRYVLYGVISPNDTTGYAARLNRGADYRWSDYAEGIPVTNANKVVYIANPSSGPVTLDIALAGVGTYGDT